MDATMQPGLNNFVMKGMESMVLPRIPASILENVSTGQTHTVTLKPEADLLRCSAGTGKFCREDSRVQSVNLAVMVKVTKIARARRRCAAGGQYGT